MMAGAQECGGERSSRAQQEFRRRNWPWTRKRSAYPTRTTRSGYGRSTASASERGQVGIRGGERSVGGGSERGASCRAHRKSKAGRGQSRSPENSKSGWCNAAGVMWTSQSPAFANNIYDRAIQRLHDDHHAWRQHYGLRRRYRDGHDPN